MFRLRERPQQTRLQSLRQAILLFVHVRASRIVEQILQKLHQLRNTA